MFPPRSLVSPVLGCAALLLLGACVEPTAPGSDPGGAAAGAPGRPDPAPSQLAMARSIPGFGGYFLDAAGRPTVYLRDESMRPQAAAALGGFLAARGLGPEVLRVLPGSYDYMRLDGWYRSLRASAFGIPGVFLGDVDEGRNRIRFGVTSPAAAQRLAGLLGNLGIPDGAVQVDVRPAIRTMATLRDRVRPLGGGLQINFFLTPTILSDPSLVCTIGFNADVGGVRSFLTNSHCTNVEGGTFPSTDYYQNLRSDGSADFIGTEAADPQWAFLLDGSCPLPFQCRYSDAARVAYAPGAEALLGGIAMTDGLTTSLDDTVHTIVGAFRIVAERPDPVVGEVVNKVGRTTGWTRGPVTETCVDILAAGTNHLRLCQSLVAALVDGGDSGSPVFQQTDGSPDVTLFGLLWGGSADTQNPEFVFSPMSGIEREMGAVTTF